MRKLSSILLISLFAFSQYARQLSYLECKFSNTFKLSSDKCDCEKQAGFDKENSDQSPFAKTHTHFHPDEFFNIVKDVKPDNLFKSTGLDLSRLPGDDECSGIYPIPWQPPNA